MPSSLLRSMMRSVPPVAARVTPVTMATLGTALLFGACATNPVTGRRELSLVSESQEIQMGRQASQNDVRRVGELAGTPAEALVKRIGVRMAAQSERPSLPWEFHLLDDAAVNAFAYPGGFIFVTRGLLTHLNSEAELAEVIGHEIGHVTAKHSVAQMSQAQLAQIGLVGASIFSSTVAKYGDVLGTGASLLFLKFGRDDELQSDALGFKYSLALKYDVRESPKVFTTLGRLSGGAGRIPEWQSTHPDPGNRVQRAEQRIAATPPAQLEGLTVNRESYLRLLDGMVFGENPRQGYFKGARFLHPDLQFQLDFPANWRTANQPDAVVALSPDQQAQLVLQLAEGTPAAAVSRFVQQQGITVKQTSQTSVNGLPSAQASFDAQTESGVLNGLVVGVAHRNQTYLMLGLTVPAVAAQRGPELDASMRSFRPVTDQAVLGVQPAKVQLVTLPQRMTAQDFVQRYPSSIPAEQVYIINGVEAATALPTGTLMKRVVGGVKP